MSRLRSPSTRREWIEMLSSDKIRLYVNQSPSTRREWIEIVRNAAGAGYIIVSLHTEGVD